MAYVDRRLRALFGKAFRISYRDKRLICLFGDSWWDVIRLNLVWQAARASPVRAASRLTPGRQTNEVRERRPTTKNNFGLVGTWYYLREIKYLMSTEFVRVFRACFAEWCLWFSGKWSDSENSRNETCLLAISYVNMLWKTGDKLRQYDSKKNSLAQFFQYLRRIFLFRTRCWLDTRIMGTYFYLFSPHKILNAFNQSCGLLRT